MGSLGQPEGGWPRKLQRVILRGKKPEKGRPGANLPPADLKAAQDGRGEGGSKSRTDLMSYLMYPDVFAKFAEARAEFGDLEVLPTPPFFYGLEEREEVTVDIEPGKTLIIRLLTVGEPRADGMRTVFFELNGQPREVEVSDKSIKAAVSAAAKPILRSRASGRADSRCRHHCLCAAGEQVKKGDRLLVMEAMKMQTTVYAPMRAPCRSCGEGARQRGSTRSAAHDRMRIAVP